MPPQKWAQREARKVAMENHEENFQSRRGIGAYVGQPIVYIYDNNPDGRRDERLAAITTKLADLGIHELARASYPSRGVDKGYTIGILYDVEGHAAGEGVIRNVWEKMIRPPPTVWDRLNNGED